MARGKGRPFEKGNVANPLGAGAAPAHLRKFKAKTYEDFIESLQKMGDMNQEDLLRIVSVEFNKTLPKDKKAKNMPIVFARFMLECQRGNMIAMKMFFEYLWGKPKEFDPASIPASAVNVRPLQNATPEQLKSLIEGKVVDL